MSNWDAATFAAHYQRYTPRLYGLALRLAGGREADAQDLVQQCWLRSATARRPFLGRARLSSWLCGILVNLYRESLRDRLVTGALPHEPATSSGEVDLDTEHLLARMRPDWREIVVLHDLYGYTHSEIGALLAIAPGTSKSRLARAHAWGRSFLNNQEVES